MTLIRSCCGVHLWLEIGSKVFFKATLSITGSGCRQYRIRSSTTDAICALSSSIVKSAINRSGIFTSALFYLKSL